MIDNPTTPTRDVTGRMMALAGATAALVLTLAALVYAIYATAGVMVTLSIWVLVALAFAAGGIGLAVGVGLMAAMAIAGQADDAMEQEAAHD